MKYVVLLLGIAVIYLILMRSAPIAPAVQAATAQEVAPLTTGPRETTAPASTALQQPLDRTRAALDQVKQRNGDGQF
jgi:hypothetical protein